MLHGHPLYPNEQNFIKVGRWSGRLNKSRERYATVYGKNMGLMIFQCAEQASRTKQQVHTALRQCHITNEIFKYACLLSLPQTLQNIALDHDYFATNMSNKMPYQPVGVREKSIDIHADVKPYVDITLG